MEGGAIGLVLPGGARQHGHRLNNFTGGRAMRIKTSVTIICTAFIFIAPAYAGGYMTVPDIAGESTR